uniref:Uncharacterized protein n=1 Tax=Anser cygnoides TaxID=8845 RepID=A0A8B9ELQ5_ANSCY
HGDGTGTGTGTARGRGQVGDSACGGGLLVLAARAGGRRSSSSSVWRSLCAASSCGAAPPHPHHVSPVAARAKPAPVALSVPLHGFGDTSAASVAVPTKACSTAGSSHVDLARGIATASGSGAVGVSVLPGGARTPSGPRLPQKAVPHGRPVPRRVTQCKYKRIGCPWQGPFHELTVHEAECTHPTKTGNELMEILDEMDQTRKKEMQLYNSIFSLLSFEKIGYTGNARRRSAGCLGPWRRAGAARGLFVGFSDIFLYFFWRSSSEEEPAMLPRGSPLVSRGVTNPSPPPPSPRKRGVPPAAVRGQGHRAESRHQNPAVCGEPGALPARGRGAEPRSTAGDPRVLSPGRQTGREESGAGGGEGFSPRPGGAAVLRGRR